MIFVTVGTQLPFPRLLNALDNIAANNELQITAQTCDPSFHSKHFECHDSIQPDIFEKKIKNSNIVISHAGIGTILSARKFSKPLIIYPRKAALGEHRNDHQMATAQFVSSMPGIYWAKNDDALMELILSNKLSPAIDKISESHTNLLSYIRDFVDQD